MEPCYQVPGTGDETALESSMLSFILRFHVFVLCVFFPGGEWEFYCVCVCFFWNEMSMAIEMTILELCWRFFTPHAIPKK